MRPRLLCFCVLLGIFLPKINVLNGTQMNGYYYFTPPMTVQQQNKVTITPMEALDLVKESYAANFDKVETEDGKQYYYKLSFANYYLVYEGFGATKSQYLFHLYEFVIDEEDTQIGHTVTYGWYIVDEVTREITEQ